MWRKSPEVLYILDADDNDKKDDDADDNSNTHDYDDKHFHVYDMVAYHCFDCTFLWQCPKRFRAVSEST